MTFNDRLQKKVSRIHICVNDITEIEATRISDHYEE